MNTITENREQIILFVDQILYFQTVSSFMLYFKQLEQTKRIQTYYMWKVLLYAHCQQLDKSVKFVYLNERAFSITNIIYLLI